MYGKAQSLETCYTISRHKNICTSKWLHLGKFKDDVQAQKKLSLVKHKHTHKNQSPQTNCKGRNGPLTSAHIQCILTGYK